MLLKWGHFNKRGKFCGRVPQEDCKSETFLLTDLGSGKSSYKNLNKYLCRLMLRPKKFSNSVFRLDHPDIWTFTMTSIELSGINHQNFNFYLLFEAKVINLYNRNSRLDQISWSVCFCEAIQT